MANLTLIATAAFGIEAIVARELNQLGYDATTVENGRVLFTATEEAICRTNLWLRCADRVLLRIGDFPARSFEELFQQTKALPWEEWLPLDACFPVTGSSVHSQLHSVPDCQAIVKKAIVERLKGVYHQEWFPETGATFPVKVTLLKDRVTLSLDTSGAGLHKRGYRAAAGQAPLKETLAAAMILLSRWREDRALIDPCCGTGTIPIEAALIALNRAPGLHRPFTAERWPSVPEALWRRARREAREMERDRECHIYGSDIDEKALRLARQHAVEAHVDQKVFFQRLPAREVRSRFSYGHLITNPPYGQRLQGEADTAEVYQQLREALTALPTWSLHLLTALPRPEQWIGRRWDKSRKLYNGRIECHYYQFFGPKPPKKGQEGI